MPINISVAEAVALDMIGRSVGCKFPPAVGLATTRHQQEAAQAQQGQCCLLSTHLHLQCSAVLIKTEAVFYPLGGMSQLAQT